MLKYRDATRLTNRATRDLIRSNELLSASSMVPGKTGKVGKVASAGRLAKGGAAVVGVGAAVGISALALKGFNDELDRMGKEGLEAKESIDALKKSSTGAGSYIASELKAGIPELQKIGNILARPFTEGGESSARIIISLTSHVRNYRQEIRDLDLQQAHASSTAEWWSIQLRKLTAIVSPVGQLNTGISMFAQDMKALGLTAQSSARGIKELHDVNGDLYASFTKTGSGFVKVDGKFYKLTSTSKSLRKAIGGVITTLNSKVKNPLFDRIGTALSSASKKADVLRAKLAKIYAITIQTNKIVDASITRATAQLPVGKTLNPEDTIKIAGDAALKAAEIRMNKINALFAPKKKKGGGSGTPSLDFSDLGSDATESLKEVKTAAELAAEAVSKFSQAQVDKTALSAIAKVTRSAANGYKATAIEAEVLKRTLPSLDASLESQRAAVQGLDSALQALQATQLKGTKAFSDQTFAIDQNVKALQLQRLDLVIAGTPEEDTAIKALDDQIAKLQQQAERVSLVESLQLDPLKKKLEQTFNPVKELGFDQIVKQFQEINAKKAPLEKAIAGGENLKAMLEATIADAEARFTQAGVNVSKGLINGVASQSAAVTAAGKASGDALLDGVNKTMQFGSPSKTMIQRGKWAAEGFVVGVNEGSSAVMTSGADTMFSFLTGMRNVYTNRVQPFVLTIAKWIRENKGPISYDKTLLQPAGQAIMQGFHKGLSDGFGEVKGWVKQVGPDLAKHTVPDSIFKEMSAEFLIGNASADLDFDPQDFFKSIDPLGGFLGFGVGGIGQSTGIQDTINQAKIIAEMFNIVPNIGSELRRYNNPAYNAAIGGAAGSLHVAGRAMDFTGSESSLDAASAWAKKYMGTMFQEVLWKTSGHYDHLHIGWVHGVEKLLADITGASRTVEEALSAASNKTGVDFNFLAAISKAESGFNPNAGSPVGARGLMQLMPSTAKSLGVSNITDPFQNALGGATYIKRMLDMFGGNKRLALAGYNAGPGNAHTALNSFSETIHYVERVLRYFKQFSTGNYRAQGGKVNAMTPYIVGERGRELFVPQQNGSVISGKDLRDLITSLQGAQVSGAGTVVNDNREINVHSNAIDPGTVAALVDSRMRSQIRGVHR